MISSWTTHLKTEEERNQFRSEVQAAKRVLRRLDEIIKQRIKEQESSELSTLSYDKPNWDYRQADTNGFKRCLRWVQTLIDLDNKEITNG